jgi:N,N-dimethylformamidase
VHNCFNGKIARPTVHAAILDAGELSAVAAGTPPAEIRSSSLVSAWDFSPRREQKRVLDRGPRSMHAEVVNAPTRAVTGPFWTGEYLDWRSAPGQYDALHFHCDDLEDCQWTVSFRWELPATLASGVYAARLHAEDAEDHIPFAVVPSDRANQAPVALILPTLTYQAYANFRRQGAAPEDFAVGDWRPQPDPRDQYVTSHPDLGLSLYDRHSDGSGCCYSSTRRPIPNLRVDYHSIRVDGPRHLGADLRLIEWLDRSGYRFDVLTDHDVHHDPNLLCGYNVVLTGTHPEYQTAITLDALQDHVRRGGNLMYLGGNGFYWVTSIDPLARFMIEVRRGVNGTRAWTSEPGESHHSSTGEPGGLWRERGRAPNRLAGVGFVAQGWDGRSPGYRRLHPDGEPEYVFAGVQGDLFGESGAVMGGAAGDEIDRVDDQLGTPSEVLRLATSTGHSDAYHLVVEDIAVMHSATTGATNPDIRSDVVLLEAPSGGRVFSVGSISWCTSLSHNDHRNDVARITANVLDEFAGSDGRSRRGDGSPPSRPGPNL